MSHGQADSAQAFDPGIIQLAIVQGFNGTKISLRTEGHHSNTPSVA